MEAALRAARDATLQPPSAEQKAPIVSLHQRQIAMDLATRHPAKTTKVLVERAEAILGFLAGQKLVCSQTSIDAETKET